MKQNNYQNNRWNDQRPPLPKNNEEDFKITEFYDGNSLLLSLISDISENNKINIKATAILLSEAGKLKYSDSATELIDSKLNINQLRKFYDSFLRIYNLRIPENEKKIKLLMLRANVEYSAARLKINRFAVMMKNRIDIVVKSNGEDFKKNLEAFKLHFEALVAYYPKG